MSPAHRAPFSLRRWLALLFRQPPQGLYRRPCLYQSGDRMEIEHFEAILAYNETRLRLQLPRGQLTIYGERLQIETLTARRITLRGCFVRTDYTTEHTATGQRPTGHHGTRSSLGRGRIHRAKRQH